jgi:hypothetical protein
VDSGLNFSPKLPKDIGSSVIRIFFALEDDVGRVLHHPFIIVIGSRVFYSFK